MGEEPAKTLGKLWINGLFGKFQINNWKKKQSNVQCKSMKKNQFSKKILDYC